jgi:hypothetical protein
LAKTLPNIDPALLLGSVLWRKLKGRHLPFNVISLRVVFDCGDGLKYWLKPSSAWLDIFRLKTRVINRPWKKSLGSAFSNFLLTRFQQ